MLAKNQKVEIKWNRRNKRYYEQLGYVFTNYDDIFIVDAEDLQKGSDVRVKVICDYCGEEYYITWYHYIEVKNKMQKNACNNCRNLKRYEHSLNNRQENLYVKALKICEKEGYALLTQKEEIKNNTTYIKYVCPIHGAHTMRINNFINGKGCPDCGRDAIKEKNKLSSDEVEQRIRNVGGVLLNKNDYVNYAEKNLLIKCPECGEPFLTSFRNFIQHGGQVCENCLSTESLGERKIRHYLENHGIVFKQEYWFENCRDINPLPFDFYLPDLNMVCEFDGRQHYGETNYFTYSFNDTKKHDQIKEQFCKDNNIYILRIPYWNVDNIDKILDKELNMRNILKECA